MRCPHQHAVAADGIFDGSIVHKHAAVLIEGERIAWIGPRRALPAHASVHELPKGCWLAPGFIDVQVNGGGGCALQRCSKPSRDHPYCSRSPTVWHDRIAPDADQRHAAEDAHRARGCTEPSPKPWHARHTFRRSVPLPCKARCPRSVEVESAHRRRRPAPRARPAVRETLSAARERKVSCLKFSALQSRKGSPRPGRKM